MATINYTISSGTAPYTVQLLLQGTETVIDTNNHGSTGSYYFTNVADNDYTLKVTDNNGCTNQFDTTVFCATTTTTTTTTTTSTTTTTTTTLAITRRLKWYNGSTWDGYPLKIYSGGQWVEKEIKNVWA